MKRILFVNAPYSAYTPPESAVPPLGLARVITETAKVADVKVVDMGCEQAAGKDSWNSLAGTMDRFQPEVLAIGPLVSANVLKGWDVARFAASLPNPPIVIAGGPDPTAAFKKRLVECEAVNAVAVGEAEILLPKFLEVCHDPSRWREVQGLAFRKGKEIVYSKARRITPGFFERLEPPDWSYFPLELYRQVAEKSGYIPYLVAEMSRGCPYECSFCASHVIFGRNLMLRPPRAVANDLEDAVTRFGYKRFSFNDDNVGIDVEHLVEVGRQILIKLSGGIEYTLSLRPDSPVFNSSNIIKGLKRSGLREVLMGCESQDPEVIRILGKTNNPGSWAALIRRAVSICKDEGIACRTNWMIGLPEQDKKSFLSTIEFIKEIIPETALLSILQPYPGTRISEDINESTNKYGIKCFSDNPSDLIASKFDPVIETRWLDKGEILNLVYLFLSQVGEQLVADISGSPYYLFEYWKKTSDL